MKIVRVKLVDTDTIFFGILEENTNTVTKVAGDIYGEFYKTNELYDLNECRLLTPIEPKNIIAIGLNYKKHALENGRDIPSKPVVFIKATTAVTGPNSNILLPKNHPSEVDFEAELAIIIGKTTKDVSETDALNYVLGYSCSNDVSARDCQMHLDKQWARGKSFDTFCPIGPWIETELDPDNCGIRTRLNGKIMQDSNTSDMIFSTRYLVSYLSHNMTLLPGTVIMTGTPEGVGVARKPQIFLNNGDFVEIEIDGIGVLQNHVKNAL